ncbi:hypothetical protein AMECASPLE_010743 [Ameca splendens]|uniref:Uncharacterized protein n=1 Tax=Ameca splendens TaxID=208324 RepID=A0ABV0Y0K3_9TELE
MDRGETERESSRERASLCVGWCVCEKERESVNRYEVVGKLIRTFTPARSVYPTPTPSLLSLASPKPPRRHASWPGAEGLTFPQQYTIMHWARRIEQEIDRVFQHITGAQQLKGFPRWYCSSHGPGGQVCLVLLIAWRSI